MRTLLAEAQAAVAANNEMLRLSAAVLLGIPVLLYRKFNSWRLLAMCSPIGLRSGGRALKRSDHVDRRARGLSSRCSEFPIAIASCLFSATSISRRGEPVLKLREVEE